MDDLTSDILWYEILIRLDNLEEMWGEDNLSNQDELHSGDQEEIWGEDNMNNQVGLHLTNQGVM